MSNPKVQGTVAKTIVVLFGLAIAGVSLACMLGTLGGDDTVRCGGLEMEEGDKCVYVNSGGSNSYEEQADANSRGDWLFIVGGACGILTGLAITVAGLIVSSAELAPGGERAARRGQRGTEGERSGEVGR
ncbi:hypothetical protein AB0B28_05180 [Glycomyces sp. NPDC046736]|uniref:hypothetical protein n=1 Tax=Glycomyces sp. NPDC046736 TaxID=3155615 RepID=UPI00340FA874